MNRPKFRVWDTEEQKWYKPTYKAYMKQLHDIHIDLDGSLLIRTIDDSGKNVTIHESMFEGRYELLQSTGLFDKNGKEIFEGDIVSAMSEGYKAIGVVKRRIDGYWLMYPAWQNGQSWKIVVSEQGDTDVEIIGNKFENRELLDYDSE
ncbi:YopX family protein [Mammaliicoccus sciuri]|uniref:YopX family protein n=1 Tax=Mammaliicoccus sciuri TaxID=1296 RepID=UPI003CF013A0